MVVSPLHQCHRVLLFIVTHAIYFGRYFRYHTVLLAPVIFAVGFRDLAFGYSFASPPPCGLCGGPYTPPALTVDSSSEIALRTQKVQHVSSVIS